MDLKNKVAFAEYIGNLSGFSAYGNLKADDN